eukprot:18139-Eustigmatos_ZCMA.PRE.1
MEISPEAVQQAARAFGTIENPDALTTGDQFAYRPPQGRTTMVTTTTNVFFLTSARMDGEV